MLRKETNIPIVAQLALHEAGTTQNGNDVNEILKQLLDYGANVVGLNCQLGPLHMTEAFKMISIPKMVTCQRIQMQVSQIMWRDVMYTRESSLFRSDDTEIY